jgi:hypothetical protein
VKLSRIRETVDYSTAKASDSVRAMSLGGLALLWVFRVEKGDQPTLPLALVFAAFCLIFALGFDVAQYVSNGVRYREHAKREIEKLTPEQKAADPDEWRIATPEDLRQPGDTFFVLKLIASSIGLGVVLMFAMTHT